MVIGPGRAKIKLEPAHKLIGEAAGPVALMIAKRVLQRATLREAAVKLRRAADMLEESAAVLTRR